MFVCPTRGIETFGNISSPFVPWPSFDLRAKFYGGRPRGTLQSGALKCKRGSKIVRWWAYRRLYHIPMSRSGVLCPDEFLVHGKCETTVMVEIQEQHGKQIQQYTPLFEL